MTFICGRTGPLLPAPDKDNLCCWESCESDGDECSCWVAVYSSTADPAIQEGPPIPRERLCVDCAYRPGSPERAENDGDRPDSWRDKPFVCHQGMPVLRGYTHPTVDTMCLWAPGIHDRDNFRPITRADRAWKADGQPAELCAGWALAIGVRP